MTRKWTDQPEVLDDAVELLSFHQPLVGTIQIMDRGIGAGAERYSVSGGNLFGSLTKFFDTLPAALIWTNERMNRE